MDPNPNENQEKQEENHTQLLSEMQEYHDNDWLSMGEDLGNSIDKLNELKAQLEEAKEQGASPEVMDEIYGKWEGAQKETEDLVAGLNQKIKEQKTEELADAFKNAGNAFKSNLNKCLRLMSGGVKDLVTKAKEGLIVGGTVLTQKISQLHNNVSQLFHTKAQEISTAFKDKVQEMGQNISDRIDMARIEEYVKATDIKDKYMETPMGERLQETFDKRDQAIEKIEATKEAKLAKNQENFDKLSDTIARGDLTKKEHFAAGVKTITDSITGKGVRDHVAEMTSEEGRAARMEAAQTKFDKSNAAADRMAGLKTKGVEKAAELKAIAQNGLGTKILERATRATEGLDKIKNPEIIKNLDEHIKNTKERLGISDEARAVATPAKEPVMPDMPGGRT